MNIQIFGTTKCFDTKKAQRYFKERGIRFQMIDLKEKEMSRGEFENVSRALGGWQALVNPNAKDKQTLALLDALVDWQKEDKLFENQQLFPHPHRPQWPSGHRRLPARHLEELGVRSCFHNHCTYSGYENSFWASFTKITRAGFCTLPMIVVYCFYLKSETTQETITI